MVWLGWSPVWRACSICAAILLAGIGWYLGSPLFIRTTLHEDLPSLTVTAAPAPVAAVTAAVTAGAGSAPLATTAPQAAPAGLVVLAQGELGYVNDTHHGKGPVRLLRIGEQRILRFEDVAITNAPDVHVYLSRETGGKWSDATSLYLGPLKATNGSFNYDIPPSADLAAYKSVVVWCRAFSVLVTWADLQRPPGT